MASDTQLEQMTARLMIRLHTESWKNSGWKMAYIGGASCTMILMWKIELAISRWANSIIKCVVLDWIICKFFRNHLPFSCLGTPSFTWWYVCVEWRLLAVDTWLSDAVWPARVARRVVVRLCSISCSTRCLGRDRGNKTLEALRKVAEIWFCNLKKLWL